MPKQQGHILLLYKLLILILARSLDLTLVQQRCVLPGILHSNACCSQSFHRMLKNDAYKDAVSVKGLWTKLLIFYEATADIDITKLAKANHVAD